MLFRIKRILYTTIVKCDELYRRVTFRGPCIVIYSYNKTNEIH